LAFGLAAVVVIGGWLTITHHPSARDTGVAAATVYTTAKGERANITLPDGSTVALNVASRLEVPSDYTTGNRTVQLTGEAFFTVQHHDRTPFTVVSGAAATRVLGTSFLVRHYAADTATEVAVQDGRVAVRTAVVAAGQHVLVSQRAMSRLDPVAATRFGFVTGVLYLDGVTLRNAVPDLNRWYDVDVRFGDSAVAMRRISSGFTAGSSHELEEFLTWTMHLRVVRNGRILTLFSR
jgi:ferric-dicitrate binding protein FerR (iron transport regulator)